MSYSGLCLSHLRSLFTRGGTLPLASFGGCIPRVPPRYKKRCRCVHSLPFRGAGDLGGHSFPCRGLLTTLRLTTLRPTVCSLARRPCPPDVTIRPMKPLRGSTMHCMLTISWLLPTRPVLQLSTILRPTRVLRVSPTVSMPLGTCGSNL